ncbi:MAG: DUF1569 domain-containing protein [Phycisphaerales bacterium]|nr:DUF1569 domain-containing protein [Phycisphaerae bacterium]NNF41440.1 DUF1569 domain-containing protein [Phycisphaerales bacterium]NNM26611.1 DUF1569 domain-containing protein [Phycisphaerales bacterium]
MTGGRRELRFDTLEEAVRDAENLLASGYDRVGEWDLAQCCDHLAAVMQYPIDGFPAFRFPVNAACWLLRHTVAPGQIRKVLARGVWRAGSPTDKRTIPAAGGDDAAAVTRLDAAVGRLLTHEGPLHASPLFGMLDRDTLVKLHRIHTAHHLSFLLPREKRD